MCTGNKFQFDTLRRAKYSSMMVLFHLHNPSEAAFVATCNVCACELDPGSGYRCEVCPDFDCCDACKERRPHPHPLRKASAKRDTSRAMTAEERHQRAAQLQRTMELLVHASSCNAGMVPGSPPCNSANCQKVRQLFQHSHECRVKAMGGCPACRRLWTLLSVHAKQCANPQCVVPRCRDLRAYRRKTMAHDDERRRAAFAHQRAMAQQEGGGGGGGA